MGMLKSLAWDDIRAERFPLTPPGLYTELVRNAEAFLNKHAEESVRREAWLARDVRNDERDFVPLCRKTGDKYGLDLDEFKMKTGSWPVCITYSVRTCRLSSGYNRQFC